MAGSYPDAPSRRMALDADGSLLITYLATTPAGITQAQLEIIGTNLTDSQREDLSSLYNQDGSTTDRMFGWIFPELREVDGVYMTAGREASTGNTLASFYTSGDTTNLVDGTWTNRIANVVDETQTLVNYREAIVSLAISNVRGVNVHSTGGSFSRQSMQKYMVYGEISAAETPDRLLWFDDDDDLEFSKPQDYGDVPRGSAQDHVVYLKNNSAAMTASSVQVTAEDIFGGSGAWYTFDEGSGFSSTLALASSIANGADSPNITVRLIIPDSAGLALHSARAYANVGSWA